MAETPTIVSLMPLGSTPPSFNATGSRGHWRTFHQVKGEWQRSVEFALMAAKIPRKLAHVDASATIRFKAKRRRDEGNFRTLLEKVVGDALTNGGWLPDDTPDFYRFDRVELAVGEPVETVIHLSYYRTEAPR